MTDERRFGHFPLFVSCEGRVFLVVGGGRVALRRVRTLMKFDFEIRLVSPKAEEELAELAGNGMIEWRRRPVEQTDLDGVSFAAICTDDRETNRLAGQWCRERGIPASIADAPEECGFFFPAVAFGDGVVAGIVGDGKDHGKTARTAAAVRSVMNEMNNGETCDD